MTDVVVLGSLNVDLVADVPRLPVPGETVLGGTLRTGPGGKGANQAVAAHRLGARTTLIGAVGDDTFATDALAALEAEGLGTRDVRQVPGCPTGVALVVVGAEGENTIVVTPGANARLTAEDADRVHELPLSGDAVLALQLEVPVATCLAAARAARQRGATVVLNCAPMPDDRDVVLDLLAAVDVLVVNETEALALLPGAEPADAEGWLALAGGLLDLGPRTAVVTLGGAGAVACSPEGPVVQPAFRVPVVDTTGAGDAFCAGLSVALSRGLPVAHAVRFACAAGALATTGLGAYPSAPTTAQVDALLDEQEVV